jgi:general secretion pathway protein C
MELLRRYVWVIDLIGIAIGAVLAGHATATFLAARLPHEPPPARAAVPRAHGPAPHDKSIDAIVDRNVFCSTCRDAPAVERTKRALRLLAIMFARPPADTRWSVAVIRDEEAATTGPYGVGAQVGEATIAAIDEVRVILEDGHGHHEILDLLPRWPDERMPGPREATFEGVRKLGSHRYEVRRAALDRFLQGGVTPPWPRIVPQMRDGQGSGLLLAGVRSDSAFAALGLASGDVLVEVNGRAIATPDAALAAYAALKTADHFALVVERSGRRVRLDYVIR